MAELAPEDQKPGAEVQKAKAPSPFKLDAAVRKELERFGFDEAQLVSFAARAANQESTVITGEIAALAASDTSTLPPPGTIEYDRLVLRGKQAIARGSVGVVILAGGMATRFGGVVKASVPVTGGKSFLAIKVADVRSVAPRAPIYVMTSAATHVSRSRSSTKGSRAPRAFRSWCRCGSRRRASSTSRTASLRRTRPGTAISSRRCGAGACSKRSARVAVRCCTCRTSTTSRPRSIPS